MTKAERLFYLANQIRNRGALTISDMALECGVSERTVYRDVSSMVKMDIPLYYKDGYHVEKDVNIPLMDMSADEVELVRYALSNNPLRKNAFFESKFDSIAEKIRQEKRVRRGAPPENVFVFPKRQRGGPKDKFGDLLARFLIGVSEKRKVKIKTGGRNKPYVQYVPIAVKADRTTPAFLVTRDKKKSLVEIPMADILELKLAGEKFVKRPVELLG